ncbi:hypothetical protein LJC68_03325 [Bacteroidales bacterium OttesenSCG-928-B11]|nr:hypothetical protein [Bacteroidales bacterium OttesenSCG-928-B11]MDL2326152.1 hypothetical protein [Bacteroidales bacterium OttesenSCG-928-A14]
MPTLTLRIEDNSPECDNLEKIKEVFGEKSSTKAIIKALEYAVGIHERRDRLNSTIERVQELEDELAGIKDMICRQIYLSEKISEYAKK